MFWFIFQGGDNSIVEKKVDDLMKIANQQDTYTRQIEKELLECRTMERKWRKEHQAQSQQKARLLEMNTRLRKDLQETKQLLTKYQYIHSTSNSEGGDDGEDKDRRKAIQRTPSLEQLNRAEENARLEEERRKMLPPTPSPTDIAPKPKRKPIKKKNKKKKEKVDSDSDEIHVPVITESQLAIYENDVSIIIFYHRYNIIILHNSHQSESKAVMHTRSLRGNRGNDS